MPIYGHLRGRRLQRLKCHYGLGHYHANSHQRLPDHQLGRAAGRASAAAGITTETNTVTITATNAGGTSPAVAQTVTAITVPVVTNQNFSRTLPMAFPDTLGTMVATANPASWAITAVSGAGAGPADFAISNSGVITTTSSAPTDITAPGTVAITVTATNATGTSAAATATLAVVSNPPPLVQSKTCNVTPPVTNGVAVSPSCVFAATCGGGSCVSPYAVTNWTIVSQTHANGFTISTAGVLQGGSNGATTTGANTVTVTATNSVATSPSVGETVNVSGTPPIVSNGSFTQALPLSAGNLSPAMTATNSPTSWAVTGASGDNAQMRDFSITSGGMLALTSFAPTDITTVGTVTINVSSTNAAGTGTGTATLTVTAALANCPKGSAFADGCAAAVPATVQFPDFFTSRAPQSGQTFVTRPPWNVAGVDYAVGVPTSVTLLDPQTNVPAGCSYNAGPPNAFLSCSGANRTITGLDFSLHGGVGIDVTSCSGNWTISNNKFQVGAAQNASGSQYIMTIEGGSCNLTLKNNTADGGAPTFQAAQAWYQWFSSGTVNEIYNSCQHFGKGCVVSGSSGNLTEQFNYAEGFDYAPNGNHGEWQLILFAGTMAAFNFSYNTFLEPSAVGQAAMTSTIYISGGTANGSSVTLANVTNNTFVTNCFTTCSHSTVTQSQAGIGWNYISVVTTNVTQNYYDPTGSFGCNVDFGGGGTRTTINYSGNVNLLDSSVVNATTCNGHQ